MAAATSNVFPLEATWLPLLHDLGVDARAVLRRAQLPEDLFSRSSTGLSSPDYFRLWSAIEAEFDRPLLPIRMAEAVRAEVFHPAIFAAFCSPNLRVALARIATYKRLIAPMKLVLRDTELSVTLEIYWLDRTAEPPVSLVTTELMFFVQLARLGTRERIVPLRVACPTPPAPAAEYTRYFGAQVQRDGIQSLTFSRGDAERPFLTANEAMWRFFEPDLRRRLAELDEAATFEDRVRAALLESLPAGESSMEAVASKLAISKRTLQRRLKDEATTFQHVLAETRETLATHYLRQTKLSGAEISYLLGFEDPNSFFRAFHLWTGRTTEQVRATATTPT
ncbi:MAG: AraC family transcriptional regulator [Myxococcales bacterium FL481]|nr:MAG: AraC family transcriptional regulator [Myxococcales bacterium FL481]